ncbi:MAG: DUF3237 domain-containing protein [Bacteroidales bacterium]|nr:DUF3237 domain-containing protein [Bacteroidales bacterium]
MNLINHQNKELKMMQKVILTQLLFLFSIVCYAQQDHKAPKLEFAFELKVTCDKAYSVGKTSHGERVVIPITGGTFEGPSIKGTVLSGGADYQLVDKTKNRTELEAIYSIRTDDGVNIHVRNMGILYYGKDGFYFRTAPKFEAPNDSKYDWLNNAIFICEPEGKDGYISLKVWMVK